MQAETPAKWAPRLGSRGHVLALKLYRLCEQACGIDQQFAACQYTYTGTDGRKPVASIKCSSNAIAVRDSASAGLFLALSRWQIEPCRDEIFLPQMSTTVLEIAI